jgi:predicted RNA-binding Zn-ribbon protein involved in translation (DUF1610 family)
MSETIKVYCNWCGKEKNGKMLRSNDGRPEGVFYDCPDCEKESVLITWGG